LAAVATFNSAVVSAAVCVTPAAAITATAAAAAIVAAAVAAAAAAAFAAARVCAAKSVSSSCWNILPKVHRGMLQQSKPKRSENGMTGCPEARHSHVNVLSHCLVNIL